MEKYIFLVVGIILLIIGAVNMTGNISSIHSYNRKKVKEEDIPKYGKLVGLGTMVIGLGCVAKFVLDIFVLQTVGYFVMLAMLVVGVGIILIAQFKYNKGIF